MNRKLRMAADVAMTALLPVLMAYSLIGEAVHEWLGLAMFALFVAHHVLNRQSLKRILKPKAGAAGKLNRLVNLLLWLVMFLLPLSGIVMSKHIFKLDFLSDLSETARLVHLLASYWGFVLMSVHLGFHLSFMRLRLPTAAKLIIVLLGAFEVYNTGIWRYLFLQSRFVFFDFGVPVIVFLLRYILMLAMLAVLANELMKIIKKEKAL